MAYNENIPQATDKPKNSQSELLGNFAALKTSIELNHVGLNDVATGKHKWATMPAQAATPPAGAFAAGEVGLYSYAGGATAKNELYINKTNQATVTQIPATASILSITSAPAANTHGWSMLPSGILIKWGFQIVTGADTVTYDATVAFGAVFSVVLTSSAGGGSNDHQVVITASGNTDFDVKSTLNSNLSTDVATTMWYFAVGRPA